MYADCEDVNRGMQRYVRAVTGQAVMLDIKGWRLLRCLRCNEPLNPKGCSVQ